MTDVFISYSRKDKELTLQLHAALSKVNRDVWVDWEDIPATADWLLEIYANIEKTDAFLFLVSPNSITSLVCNLEIAHAVKFNKRLIPIIYDNVDFDAVLKEASSIQPDTATQLILGEHSLSTMMRENWKSLSRHNWLFFRHEQEFEENFPKLIQAIDTDLNYVHDHTRWLVRALEWDAKNHNASFLLSGAQLREAERWLADSGAKEPTPNKLHTEYILASRRREGQRQRTLFVAVLAALVIAVALAVFGFIQSQAAQSALGVAEARGTDAANNAGTAIANAATATIAQGRAQIEADNAATQAVIAQNAATSESDARATSVINERIALTNAAEAATAQGQAQIEANNAATQAVAAQNAATSESDARATSVINERIALTNAAEAATAQGQAQIEANNAATQAVAAQNAATAESDARATSVANERIALTNAAAAATAQDQAQIEANNAATQAVAAQNAATAESDARATSVANEQIAVTNAAVATVAQGQAQSEAVRALAAQATAEQRANETQSLALTVAVEQLLSLGNPDLALALALEAIKVDLNSWVAQNRLLKVAFAPGTQLVFAPGHTGPITHMVYSPDGQYVASSSLDSTIILWDAKTGQQIRRFAGHSEGVNSVAFSADGETLISASDDNSLILWNLDGGQIRSYRIINARGEDLNRDATAAVFRQDGQTIVSSWADGQVVVFERSGRDRIHLLVANSPITDLDLSPDRPGQFFLAVSDTSVEVWDTRAEAQRRIFVGSGGVGAYSPDGNYVLISAASDRNFNPEGHDLILREITSGIERGRYRGHNAPVTDVVFLADGERALSSGEDGVIILWDIPGQREIRRYYGHNAPVAHLAVSPDGRSFVSADINQQIRLWEIEPTGVIRRFDPADHIVEGVRFSRDNQTLLVSYDDHNLGFWNVADGTPGIRLFGHPAAITSFAYSPDEQLVVSADISGTVSLWNTRTYDRVRDLSFSTKRAVVDYNPDGLTIAVGDADGRMRIWDAQNGTILVRRDTDDAGPITGLRYFAGGSRLLTIHPDALVIRDSQTGDILQRIASPWEITQAVFSPDEHYLLTATGSSVITWDMTADPISFDAFGGDGDGETHEGDVTGLAFSPDGSAAVSSSADGTIRLWDVANRRLLYIYRDGDRIPRGVTFQADGRAFVASYDNTITFFKSGARVALDEWIQHNRYVVQLTCQQRDQYNIKPSCDDAGSVPTLTPTGTLLPTLTPTITLTPSPTLPPTEVPLPVGRIEGAVGRVNVRAENFERADLLTQLDNGDMVFILEDSVPASGWLHIRTQEGVVGWVIRQPVKLLGEGTFLPTIQPGGRTATPTPTMTPLPEVTLRSDNNGNINVRSGHGDNFPIVARVPSGTTALVISAPPEYIWTQIRLANGVEGWVYRPVVH